MPDLLDKFYLAYAEWLDKGAPDGELFLRNIGLCHNLRRFFALAVSGQKDWYSIDVVNDEMARQFRAAGLDHCFPFNGGMMMDYQLEKGREECHINPLRIAWVRDQVKRIRAEKK